MARISRPATRRPPRPTCTTVLRPERHPFGSELQTFVRHAGRDTHAAFFLLPGASQAAKTTAGPGGEAPRITNTNRDKWYIADSGASMCVRPWTWTSALLHYMSENLESANGVLRVRRFPLESRQLIRVAST